MPGYNPHAGVLGLEWRPTIQTDITLSGPSQGLALRVVPGAGTIDTVYPFLKNVTGQPGFAIDVLSTLEPPVPTTPTPLADGTVGMGEHHFIGTDTSGVFSGWQRQDGSTAAGVLRGAIDDFPPNTTDYIRNTSALAPNSKLQFAGRGNDTALTGKRIDAIEIVVAHRTNLTSTTAKGGPRVQGYLNLSGQTYLQNRQIYSPADGRWRQQAVGFWRTNPATNLPWTLAEVNSLVSTTAADEWGFQIDSNTVGAQAFNASMVVMVVFHSGTTGGGTGGVGDVRMGHYYQQETPPVGWSTFPLTGTSAELSATYYYLNVYPLSADGALTIPVLRDPRPDFRITSAASETGFHRQAYLTQLSASGIVQSYQALPGSMIPLLFSAGATFNSQSQAFAQIANIEEDTTSTANLAQQITTTGSSVLYKSIRIPLGWATAVRPSAPLNIQIQHGANASTGGGTLLANIFVQPEETTQNVVDRAISLGPGITPPTSTKLYVLIDSSAAAGAGWQIGRLDTRSDAVVGPTASQVQKQSYGPASGDGETDSQSNGTTDFDRYDLEVLLLGDPGEVGGIPNATLPTLTATVVAAT